MKVVLEIDEEGNVHCLYTDRVNLFLIGLVTGVRKASDVDFNQEAQVWEVISLEGKVLYQNSSRQVAIDWEIVQFSPGGEHCAGRKNICSKIPKKV